MTVRGKDADKFWFSLFHELGHVILGHVFNDRTTTVEEEEAANCYARDILIPMHNFNAFVKKYHQNYSEQVIKQFSKEIGIDPGIVVGRLQKQNEIAFSWHNCLKKKYVI